TAVRSRNRADSVFKRRPEIRSRGAPCGDESKQDPRQNRDGQGEEQNSGIGPRNDEQRISFCRNEREQTSSDSKSERDTNQPSGRGEHHTFHKKLADKLAARGAKR